MSSCINLYLNICSKSLLWNWPLLHHSIRHLHPERGHHRHWPTLSSHHSMQIFLLAEQICFAKTHNWDILLCQEIVNALFQSSLNSCYLPLSYLWVVPWSSTTFVLPAFVWSLSTFWVIRWSSLSLRSHSARIRCPMLGWKEENWGHATKFLAQYLLRACSLSK